eukprot:1160821-Pelagomonas_calceolata.AAC.9
MQHSQLSTDPQECLAQIPGFIWRAQHMQAVDCDKPSGRYNGWQEFKKRTISNLPGAPIHLDDVPRSFRNEIAQHAGIDDLFLTEKLKEQTSKSSVILRPCGTRSGSLQKRHAHRASMPRKMNTHPANPITGSTRAAAAGIWKDCSHRLANSNACGGGSLVCARLCPPRPTTCGLGPTTQAKGHQHQVAWSQEHEVSQVAWA